MRQIARQTKIYKQTNKQTNKKMRALPSTRPVVAEATRGQAPLTPVVPWDSRSYEKENPVFWARVRIRGISQRTRGMPKMQLPKWLWDHGKNVKILLCSSVMKVPRLVKVFIIGSGVVFTSEVGMTRVNRHWKAYPVENKDKWPESKHGAAKC